MEFSQADIRRIAGYGRSASKASSIESVVMDTFDLFRNLAPVSSLSLVYSFDHAGWQEWRTIGETPDVRRWNDFPAPGGTGYTERFSTDDEQAGYITISSTDPKPALVLQIVAPIIWNALLLQSAVRRVRKAETLDMDVVRATLRGADEERRRISREIHDDLGSSIASLKLSLKWAEDLLRNGAEPEAAIQELCSSRQTVAALLEKVRDLSHTLYPRVLETVGFSAALKELTLQVARLSRLEVSWNSKGHDQPLDPAMGVALYRCCQEAFNNVVRHAEASRLSIEVDYGDREVRVVVEDDGRGFDPRSLYDLSGKMMSSGFWTIRQRIAELGGAFRLSTAIGQGTVIEFVVPHSIKVKNGKRKNKVAYSR